MPFRRRGSSIRPVNRLKHIVDAEGGINGVTNNTVIFARARNVRADPFDPTEVLVGSTINGIFITVFAIGSTGAPVQESVNWFLFKQRTGQAGSIPLAGETGVSTVRNQIFHEEKGLVGSGDGTAMAFKGVIAIPKGMRRMREGDELKLLIRTNSATAGEANFCAKVIYNEFF